MNRFERRFRKVFGLRRKPQHWQRSYAQEGEDMVLQRFFDQDPNYRGFYVDVGAHHPSRFSNTRYFYDRGWRGISIDPLPGFAANYLAERPEDVAIESAIADVPGELQYHMFDEPALNGFDAELSQRRDRESNYRLIERRPVPVQRLDSLLDTHLPPRQTIDFLSIDVEGLDLEVLKSNDWERFRPQFVLVEIYGETLQDIFETPSVQWMDRSGYQACSRTRSTVFFRDKAVMQSAAA